MKKIILSIAMLLIMCWITGCSDYRAQYEELRLEYINLQQETRELKEEIRKLEGKLEREIWNLENIEKELKLYKESGVRVFSNTQPPYMKNWGWDEVSLINNPIAHNPTWAELESFIKTDETDSELYLSNLCGWFAEQIHNNAEEAGIKTAFVAINFEVEVTHALNAFNTTDRGLVYIDCTGGDMASRIETMPSLFTTHYVIGDTEGWDKIAYVEKDKPLGLISISTTYGLKYSNFEQWKLDVQRMEDKFNNASSHSELRRLEELSDGTLGSFWEEGDIVKTIEIYW